MSSALTFDELLARQSRPSSPSSEQVSVDLSQWLGEGAVFVYRAPSVADLYAVADPAVLAEWKRQFPEMPDALAVQLELYARLHIAPPSAKPLGQLYAELVNALPPAQAIACLRKIETALADAFGLRDLETRVDEKKGDSSKVKKR